MRSIGWDGGDIVVIDQRALPQEQVFIRLRSTEEIADAIRTLRVRGAPALGIIGAMGVAQAALLTVTDDRAVVLGADEEAAEKLRATRPTAINLGWAIDRVLAKGRAVKVKDPEKLADVMIEEALAIRAEDEESCLSIAKNAIELFEPKTVVLTHCNTGSLVTGGIGTALGAIRYAHESGYGIAVVATETRPLLQGARLTAWELARLGIPNALVIDAAAPSLIARGEVHVVMVGADRIAANGDVANKVGTYPLALAAREAGIPFIVLAPTSTIDASMASGGDIPVEERPPEEVTTILGSMRIAPAETQSINPAFDITPADLVTAIVTERGIARAPYKRTLARMVTPVAAPPNGKSRTGSKGVKKAKDVKASGSKGKTSANGRGASAARSKAARRRSTGGAKRTGRSTSSTRTGRAGGKRSTR